MPSAKIPAQPPTALLTTSNQRSNSATPIPMYKYTFTRTRPTATLTKPIYTPVERSSSQTYSKSPNSSLKKAQSPSSLDFRTCLFPTPRSFNNSSPIQPPRPPQNGNTQNPLTTTCLLYSADTQPIMTRFTPQTGISTPSPNTHPRTPPPPKTQHYQQLKTTLKTRP